MDEKKKKEKERLERELAQLHIQRELGILQQKGGIEKLTLELSMFA